MGNLKLSAIPQRKYEFVLTDIKLPKILLQAYTKLKKVLNYSSGGIITVPKRFVGKEFYVILIPKEEYDKTYKQS